MLGFWKKKMPNWIYLDKVAVRASWNKSTAPDNNAGGIFKTVESKEVYVCKQPLAVLQKSLPHTGPMNR